MTPRADFASQDYFRNPGAGIMLSMHEPDHKRLRDIVDEAFRRRAVLDMEPHIQTMGDELADRLFAEGSPADLVARYARKLPLSIGSKKTGAASISQWRNFCDSSRRCNSPNPATCAGISNSAGSGLRRATRSWSCWQRQTWTLGQIPIRTGSICNASRTGISPSAPESISALAINSRVSKADAR